MKMTAVAAMIMVAALRFSAPGVHPQGNGSITRFNGDPIAGVRIQLTNGLLATTNDDGVFAIPDVPPGRYGVFLERMGFAFPASKPRAVGAITVDPGVRIVDFHVEMIPAGTIAGRIVDSKGAPYFNGSVGVESLSYDNGRKSLVRSNFSQSTTTDDLGN
jgi:hypothetical protein